MLTRCPQRAEEGSCQGPARKPGASLPAPP